MTLRDRFYLRFFLFHKRYGRVWAAMLEFLVVWIAATLFALTLFFLIKVSIGVYQDYTTSKERAAQAQAQKVAAEQMLLDCLNGRIVGRSEDGLYIGCEGAMTFRM